MGDGMDQRQSGLAFGQVVTQVLAQGIGIGAVVQHIVGNLEGITQMHAVVVKCFLDVGIRS